MVNTIFHSEDGSQAYLTFQPVYRYFETVTNTNYILSWKSKGLSAESIKPPTTSNNSLNPELSYHQYNIKVKFTENCLKQPRIEYTHKKVVNIYIVYELIAPSSHSDDPALKSCLFGAVTLTKNADTDKYGYSGYGIGFDRRSSFISRWWIWSKCIDFWNRVFLFILIIKKRYISSWKRSKTRIRTYFNSRKNVSN